MMYGFTCHNTLCTNECLESGSPGLCVLFTVFTECIHTCVYCSVSISEAVCAVDETLVSPKGKLCVTARIDFSSLLDSCLELIPCVSVSSRVCY